MDTAKLARMQAAAKKKKEIGGKGLARSKVTKAAGGLSGGDDKKLQAALKKLPVQQLTGVEEVNMFKDNSRILHFSQPKVHAAAGQNTYAIYGTGQDKDLTELVPGIIPQLGPESIANLRKMAESYGSMHNPAGGPDDDDDDVPDLVESFDVADNQGESKLEELE